MAHIIFCKTLLITIFMISCKAVSAYDIKGIFAFGDSTLDTGNNNHLLTMMKANFPPYGKVFPNKKATGRFSDGKLVPDFVVSALNLSGDLLPAYAGHKIAADDYGVCFASAGTGLDDETATRGNVRSIAEQVEDFKAYVGNLTALKGEEETQEFIKKSVFVTSIGTNDIILSYYLFPERKKTYSLPQYHAFLLTRLKAFLQKLYALGARNFAVAGLPPIGCVPIQLTVESIRKSIIPGLPDAHRPKKCIQEQNDAAQSYNIKLQHMIQELLWQFNSKEKTRAAYLDIYSSILDMSNNPQKYGFVETKKGCCGKGLVAVGPLCNPLDYLCSNSSQYMFFDAFHPTQAAYKVIADDLITKMLPTFA